MAEYRAYVIGSDGQFYRSVLLECGDDAEALERTKKLLDGHDIQLWQLDRKVAMLEHKPHRIEQKEEGLERSRAMTERDRWKESLRCPHCGAVGEVVLSQASPNSPAYHDGSDQNVRVELAPGGFRFDMTEFGSKFYCAACGVPAIYT